MHGEVLESGVLGRSACHCRAGIAALGCRRSLLVRQLCQRRILCDLPGRKLLPGRCYRADQLPCRNLLHNGGRDRCDMPDRVLLSGCGIGLHPVPRRIFLSAGISHYHRLSGRTVLPPDLRRQQHLQCRTLLPRGQRLAHPGNRRDVYCRHRRNQCGGRRNLPGRELLRGGVGQSDIGTGRQLYRQHGGDKRGIGQHLSCRKLLRYRFVHADQSASRNLHCRHRRVGVGIGRYLPGGDLLWPRGDGHHDLHNWPLLHFRLRHSDFDTGGNLYRGYRRHQRRCRGDLSGGQLLPARRIVADCRGGRYLHQHHWRDQRCRRTSVPGR